MPHTTLYIPNFLSLSDLDFNSYMGNEFPVYLNPNDETPTYSACIVRIPNQNCGLLAQYEILRWIYQEIDALKKLEGTDYSVRTLHRCFINSQGNLVLLKNPIRNHLGKYCSSNETHILYCASTILYALQGLYNCGCIPPYININTITEDLSGYLCLELCANHANRFNRRLIPDESNKKEELPLLPPEQLIQENQLYPNTMSKNTWQLGCLLVHFIIGRPAFEPTHRDNFHLLETIIYRLNISATQIERMKDQGIIPQFVYTLILDRIESRISKFEDIPTLSTELQTKGISKETIKFILRLLDPNPNTRLSVEEALNLQIISEISYDDDQRENEESIEQNNLNVKSNNLAINYPQPLFPQCSYQSATTTEELRSKVEQLRSEIKKFAEEGEFEFASMFTNSNETEVNTSTMNNTGDETTLPQNKEEDNDEMQTQPRLK